MKTETADLTKVVDALMSIAPERAEGWLAMMPMLRPRIRAKPTTMFGA